MLIANAQETSPITSDNYTDLQSVMQIDFTDLDDTRFLTGWFALNADGTRYAVTNGQGTVFDISVDFDTLSYTTEEIQLHPSDETLPVSVVDAVYVDDDLYILYTLDGQAMLNDLMLKMQNPIALFSGNKNEAILYIEDSPVLSGETQIYSYRVNPLEPLETLPYAPATVDDAVRIGRIPLPYVVTSTFEGVVTLWDVEGDSKIAEVDNGTLEPSVFGNINTSASHLVWRDNPNQNLYLLDFSTGDNQYIDDLNGQYAQWYFLSNEADVIIAVNLEFQPIIVAWDVVTSERTNLGDYRQCERPQPDMSRFSADGSTLVIGCDTGLDIWRIPQEN